MNIKKNLIKFGDTIKKYSPELLAGASIISGAGCVYTACKATTKAEATRAKLEEEKQCIEEVYETYKKSYAMLEEIGEEDTSKFCLDYSEADYKKDRLIYYKDVVLEYGKIYAPAVLLGATSIVCLLSSVRILKARHAATAAALATMTTKFNNYRANVVEYYGENTDFALANGLNPKSIKNEEFIDENGNRVNVKAATVKTKDELKQIELYSVPFENTSWVTGDIAFDLMNLENAESYMNDRLRINGRVYLNEVLDYLGLPKTKEGQILGWIYDLGKDENGNPITGYIDFGLFHVTDKSDPALKGKGESKIYLDFNVQGDIWSKQEFSRMEVDIKKGE